VHNRDGAAAVPCDAKKGHDAPRRGETMSATTTKAPTRDEIVARAKALAPKLRERSEQAEQQRRVPDTTIADLKDAQLARICQPSRYGGFDLGWDVLCESSMELAHGCAAQAWVCGVYGEHACLVGHFPDEAQKDVWGRNPAALISSAYFPAGKVGRADGGYVLTGQWHFSSGVHHADWTVLGGLVHDQDQPPQMVFFLIPASDRKIVDDWRTMGMAGTGSCSFDLDKVFVPEHRTCSARAIADATAPGARVNLAPVFRLPIIGYAHTQLCSVVVGAAEGLVEEFGAFLRARHQSGIPMPTMESQQLRVAEAAAEVRAARLLLLVGASAFMSRLEGGHTLGEEDATPIERDGCYAAVLAKRAAVRVFEATGSHTMFEGNGLQRRYRDIVAAASHIALNWDKGALDYGRRVMGLPVQSLF
jgi:3-hydroxy-9,10-secoandrosta-1,3,5(10)-triene-9,17-dione monooxygenase